MKIIKGDQVIVISGKDKGQKGQVERVYPKSNKIIVKGLNIYKKHMKKSEAYPKGGIVEVNRPIQISKVMLICPSCKERTRVGFSRDTKDRKQRLCKSVKKSLVKNKKKFNLV